MTAAQTKAQRLADSISRIDTFTEHQRSEIQKAAALLRRQEELLRQALEALIQADQRDGIYSYELEIAAIRNHLEAK